MRENFLHNGKALVESFSCTKDGELHREKSVLITVGKQRIKIAETVGI